MIGPALGAGVGTGGAGWGLVDDGGGGGRRAAGDGGRPRCAQAELTNTDPRANPRAADRADCGLKGILLVSGTSWASPLLNFRRQLLEPSGGFAEQIRQVLAGFGFYFAVEVFGEFRHFTIQNASNLLKVRHETSLLRALFYSSQKRSTNEFRGAFRPLRYNDKSSYFAATRLIYEFAATPLVPMATA